MVNVFFALIFHAKIVHNEGEGDGAGGVLPETGSILAFIISVGGKAFPQELVG